MQFADPQQRANAFLILRHLYDGDVIEWPIADDHVLKPVFDALEQQGYVARWDRMWPLHDRYRLTESGIAQIEGVYKPDGAEAVWNDLRARGMSPSQRRAYLQQQGYDPTLWPLLHDPSTNWDTYDDDRGFWWGYVWEDQMNRRYRHRPVVTDNSNPSGYDDWERQQDRQRIAEAEEAVRQKQHTVDLDREAMQDTDVAAVAAPTSDYDVS